MNKRKSCCLFNHGIGLASVSLLFAIERIIDGLDGSMSATVLQRVDEAEVLDADVLGKDVEVCHSQ